MPYKDLMNFAILGFATTVFVGPLVINLLYKMNIVVRHVLTKNKMNQEFINIHSHKSGTPTMGGLMISIVVFVWALILIPYSPLKTVFLVGWVLMTLYGLIEGSLVFARKVDEKFRLLQETFGWRIGKLVILYLLAFLLLWMTKSALGITEVNLIGNIIIPLNLFWLIAGAFFFVLALYGIEITDGADGLVTGQFIVAFIAYITIALLSGHFEIFPYLGLMLGSSMVYLYFNINPARVFMGGTGTLPIGFALILFALVTNTVFELLIMGSIFWIELFSSGSQIIAIKFFNRKIFRIAPIHHHFEAIGWSEAKVVQRFWLGSGVAAMIAIWVFSMVN